MAKIDVFALPVFPAADIFPIMAEKELQELAADIKENGLREPLVIADVGIVNGDGEVVRLLNGEDPIAYVISANLHRRHMTNGQRAMAVALVLETNKATQQDAAKSARLSQPRIAQAHTVMQFAGDLVDEVLSGATSLDDAYQKARERKKAKDWRNLALSDLRDRAADLAQRVVDGELRMDEAKILLEKRDEQQRNIRLTVFRSLGNLRYAASFAHGEAHRALPAWLEDEDITAEFRVHVPGGVEELRRYVADLGAATHELEALVARLPKKRSRK
jgi:hypothetical protein